ncbi:hypothetical protein FACS1894111_02320 [Clostridia bacterium]|nr:hypothetical protein FACS1894111_02320 [Clostridia bacterium]
MSEIFRFSLGIGVLVYFLIVIHLLRLRLLDLKYTLLWLGAGLFMAVLVIWPEPISLLVNALGITLPVNGVFTIFIALILIIVMTLTSIVSMQTKRIKRLVQQLALLEHRIRELEERGE